MKQYHIFKDSTLFETVSARKRAISSIRQAQDQETHFLLRAQFSIIYGAVELVPPIADDAEQNASESSLPLSEELPPGGRYHILKDGVQYGSTPTREQALFMIRQARKHRAGANFSILYGTEEFIRYSKRRQRKVVRILPPG